MAYFIHLLDHVFAELKSEVQVEQVRAKVQTNLVLDQGKTQCIPPIFIEYLL
jgi:hypothetical protein